MMITFISWKEIALTFGRIRHGLPVKHSRIGVNWFLLHLEDSSTNVRAHVQSVFDYWRIQIDRLSLRDRETPHVCNIVRTTMQSFLAGNTGEKARILALVTFPPDPLHLTSIVRGAEGSVWVLGPGRWLRCGRGASSSRMSAAARRRWRRRHTSACTTPHPTPTPL